MYYCFLNTCTRIMSEKNHASAYRSKKKYLQGNEANLHNYVNLGKTGFVERSRKF